MIKRLRTKFIRIAMLSVALVLLALSLAAYLVLRKIPLVERWLI